MVIPVVTLVDTVTDNTDLVTAAAVNTAVEAGQVGTDATEIVADTSDMQPKFGTMVDLGSGAFIGSNLSNLAGPTFNADTDSQENITDDVAALNNISTADVNTQVLDVMNVDTITLPANVAPPLAPTHRQALAHLYKAYRNRKEQTATTWTLMADNETTPEQKATVSDNGTTAIKQEIVAGT